ncbi:hypothetical protein ACFPTO_00885 [Paraburkholderia denitrificans]|uniref:Uncharacterized protein n=1 Tax=Paraburkholderia denitrificans TaxID=694025 RepID=A0ABW0J2X1_9BURK
MDGSFDPAESMRLPCGSIPADWMFSLFLCSTYHVTRRDKTMIERADIAMRRKRYAMYRLGLAMDRLMKADGECERVMATRWVNAWGRAIGERWFARRAYGSDRHPAAHRPMR